MTPIWTFLFGVVFGVVLGWGLATLRCGKPRTPDAATLAAVLDRIKRESQRQAVGGHVTNPRRGLRRGRTPTSRRGSRVTGRPVT